MESKPSTLTVLTPEESVALALPHIPNINLGIMGHIDSGKTALCRILTKTASTASLDKNPTSQSQGITIDIGFSSFIIKSDSYRQYTLVDCPGHASFIKSVIAGACIIDLMLLVIDVKKGIQVQTAECIALGEMMRLKLIVVLNKCDTLKEGFDSKLIEKTKAGLRQLFAKTSFINKDDFEIVEFSCKEIREETLVKLLDVIYKSTLNVERKVVDKEKMVMACDHCFTIKGKGTVLTGTLTHGKLTVGDEIELPEYGITKPVKGIQIYRKQVKEVSKGDRAAVLVGQLNSEEIERCLVTAKGVAKKVSCLIAKIKFCSYYKGTIPSRSKFHISVGHVNTMADLWMFCSNEEDRDTLDKVKERFDSFDFNEINTKVLDFNKQYKYVKEIDKDKVVFPNGESTYGQLAEQGQHVLAYLKFPKPLYLLENSFMLGSRFDFQIDKKNCRIAFSGISLKEYPEHLADNAVSFYVTKTKKGLIEKFFDNYTVIVKDMFKKETNIAVFLNKEVKMTELGLVGRLSGSFGASGKVKVVFNQNVKEENPDIVGKEVYIENKKIIKLE